MRNYSVERVDEVDVTRSPLLDLHYLMSPYVWVQDGHHRMALRVVDPTEDGGWGASKTYFAQGDGLQFTLMDTPALSPGPWADDLGGCEDPTVFFHGGECRVYYTGWNAHVKRSKLLYASGPDISKLTKRGEVLHGVHHWNTKEASLANSGDDWRLFFEYSEFTQSLIGVASADTPSEKWIEQPDPFGPREGGWDGWHLSTGPVALRDTDRPIMFYNGSDKEARWRIGWIEFTPDFKNVVRRCENPLITPDHLPAEFYDIAFSASAVEIEAGKIGLYYSVGDRKLFRAVVVVSE